MGAIRLLFVIFFSANFILSQETQYKETFLPLNNESYFITGGKATTTKEKLEIESEDNSFQLISDAYLIPIQNAEPFMAISLNIKYNGSLDHQNSKVYIRASKDGRTFGDWKEAERFDLSAPEDGSYKTDLIFFEKDAKYFQVKLTMQKNIKNDKFVINEIKTVFISPGKTSEEEIERNIKESNQKIYEIKKDKDDNLIQSYPRPSYVARSSWGASLGLTNTNSNRTTTTVTHLVLHHSAGDTYASDYAAVVRSYYIYHTQTNGWADIGYNWLVDPNGVVYQGRAWKSSTEENVVGSHNSGYNGYCLGLNIIGNYEVYQPTQASLNKMAELMAFLCDKFNLDPLATTYFAPMGVLKPVITGHKHSGGGTECPGQYLIAKYDWFRTTVNNLINGGAGVVSLLLPLNDAKFISIKPQLSWNSLSGANNYQLQLSKKSDFSSEVVINENNLTNTTYQVSSNLDYGKKYYWRVKADNTQSWSETRNFTTDPMQPIWERSSRSNNKPEWFGSNTERGIAYTNQKLYVVSRSQGLKVKVLQALTGEDIGELSTENISEGTYYLNDVESTWDGKILACNLTVNANKVPFKIYLWNNDNSKPQLFISFTSSDSVRLGDNFTVYGSLSSNAAIYAAASNSNKVYRWLVVNGALESQTPTLITLQNFVLGTTPSIAPYGYDSNSDFYANSLGKQVTLFSSTGVNKGSISGGVIPSSSSAIKTFVKDDKRFIATFQFNNTASDPNGQNVRLVDATAGSVNVSENNVYGITPRLGEDNNPNGTGDFAYYADNNGNYIIFVLATNSGIGAYWCKAEPLYAGGNLTEVDEKGTISNTSLKNYKLAQNYPNPFNPMTMIEFSLPEKGYISLEVFDIVGRKVAIVAEGFYNEGTHKAYFDASNLNSGIYIYRLKTYRITLSKKMVLIK